MKIVWLAICIGAIVILFSLIQYNCHFGWSIANTSAEWEAYSNFLQGIVSTVLTAITLVVTTAIAITFNRFQQKTQIQQITVDLFKEFRSQGMLDARNGASEMRKNWHIQVRDEKVALINEIVTEEYSSEVNRKYGRAIYDLFAFYTMLIQYKGQAETLRSLRYFYYGWWRKFLYEYALLYDEVRISHVKAIDAGAFKRADFIEAISFTRTLRELAKLCGFQDLDSDFEIYKPSC